MIPLILASKSQARASLLSNAGLSFDTSVAQIDERAAEQPLLEAGASPADIASLLAQVKATEVSCRNPGALVIGADQTLGFGDKRFNKPEDDAAARRQLLELAGHSHQLNSAVACVKDGGNPLEPCFDSYPHNAAVEPTRGRTLYGAGWCSGAVQRWLLSA